MSLEFFSSGARIINVPFGIFGGAMRAGDLIAAVNFLEYLRGIRNDRGIQFHIPDEAVMPRENCLLMRRFLLDYTDYLSEDLGENALLVVEGTELERPGGCYNLWNIRKDVRIKRQDVFAIEDAVRLLGLRKKSKIVIAPLVDAEYNFARNWSLERAQAIIDSYRNYPAEKFVCASKQPIPNLDLGRFQYSHDYAENLRHIMECEKYVGGDTGLSHFAGALYPRPSCDFHYPIDGYGTTEPFYWKTRGRMIYY